jgi:hypothetical protein
MGNFYVVVRHLSTAKSGIFITKQRKNLPELTTLKEDGIAIFDILSVGNV